MGTANKYDIAVLGGGAAGCCTARVLSQLGHSVVIISSTRRQVAFEGFSERVMQGLQRLGFEQAVQSVGPCVQRVVSWNANTSAVNHEYVVERNAFDKALRADMVALGIPVIAGRVQKLHRDRRDKNEWLITGRGENAGNISLQASFVVEARGRRSPVGKGHRMRGPATTALSRMWRLDHNRPGTAAASYRGGWAWYASAGDGLAAVQVEVSARDGELPPRGELENFYERQIEGVLEARGWLKGAKPEGPIRARFATPCFHTELFEDGLIRVGDAALAGDPLSGQGVFEGVAGAFAAGAVINTILRQPRNADLARSFYNERAETTFLRHVRTGRDFYRLEERWANAPFWHARANYPDNQPAHASPLASTAGVEQRPVVEDGFIVRRDVVVTPDHPRGIFQIAGVPVASLLKHLNDNDERDGITPEQLSGFMQRPSDDIAVAIDWLRYRQLVI